MSKKPVRTKKTSISIGNYYEEVIKREILSGRYNSASEVVRAGLRLLEKEELKTEKVRKKRKINTKTKTNGIAKQTQKFKSKLKI